MLGVFCAVEESGRAFGDGSLEESELCGIMLEFGFVAGFELGPLLGIVGEPLSQVVAGSDLFEPEIDVSFFFGEAARPEAIDEDAGAVGFFWFFVDALELWGHVGFSFLGTVAAVLHRGELFGTRPGDGEEKGGVGFGFDVVADRVAESEEGSGGEVVRLSIDGDAELAFEDLDGEGAVGVVLLHVGGVLHRDKNDAEVVFLEEGFGIDACRPGFFLLGFG